MRKKFQGLSGNELKIIAAVSMTADHIGYMLFPNIIFLRIIGRLAFPLFSFFIWQGTLYTGSKIKYCSKLAGLGLICILGYYVYCGEIYINSLVVFSLSACILFGLQYFKKQLRSEKPAGCLLGLLSALGLTILSYFLCKSVYVDYGFQGIMLPVFAEIFDSFSSFLPFTSKKICFSLSLAGFAIGILWLSLAAENLAEIQFMCLFSVPLLLLYNGRRGKLNMKGFFYWFYPLHLLVIGAVGIILQI
ncbi:MAG: conjugal transfer protein TraX [Clostridiales bacterium]|nr:conjugal transfer protein TraX [Clostridiales bacterium]